MPTDIPMFDVLLERMKTHPEEFSEGIESSRWGSIIERYSDCLTSEEKQSLADGIHSARRQMLNEAIMKKLAGEEEPILIKEPYRFNTTSRTLLGNTTAEHETLRNMVAESLKRREEELEMKAMHEYYKNKGQAE